mmetsp:Transcript_13116/g.32089  ORF Transcript_13116/g.32089 Transcript_13116/m.32089 type:complete len:209 (+) Transcript_13116:963-1589(+)
MTHHPDQHSLVHTGWVTLDQVHRLDGIQHLLAQRPCGLGPRLQVLGQLVHGARAHDHRRDEPPAPAERVPQLCWCEASLLGDGHILGHCRLHARRVEARVARSKQVEARPLGRCLAGEVLASDGATSQRAPGQQAQARLVQHLRHVTVCGPVDQIITVLDCDWSGHAHCVCGPTVLHHAKSCLVTQTPGADLALLYKLAHGLCLLLKA